MMHNDVFPEHSNLTPEPIEQWSDHVCAAGKLTQKSQYRLSAPNYSRRLWQNPAGVAFGLGL